MSDARARDFSAVRKEGGLSTRTLLACDLTRVQREELCCVVF